MTIKLLMGNEAFAWAALEAGVNVVAGYPGTPSSELVETVARLHAEGTARGVHVEWSTNEKAALEVAAAASYCGARALFTCKQVGLNVASDALMSLNYVGTGGGLVLFVADDPGPISSQTEQDTRRFAAFAKVPVLDPSTPEEGYAMMRQAFELSERYGTPVIVRPTTRICHASTFFELPEFTDARPIPEQGFQKDPKWIIFPKRAFEGHGEVNRRLARIAWDYAFTPEFAQFNHVVEEPGSQQLAAGSDANATWVEAAAQSGHGHGGTAMPRGKVATSGESDVLAAADSNEGAAARVGIVAGGVSAQYAREALALLQQWAAEAGAALPPYRFLAVGTPYPFPAETGARFAEGLTDVLVLEELDSVLEEELLKLAGQRHLPLRVSGKLTGEAPDRGENSTEVLAQRIARFFDRTAAADTAPSEGGRATATEASAMAGGTEDQGASCAAKDGAGNAPAPSGLSALTERNLAASASAPYEGPLPVRPPVLCAGCPHRGSFFAIKKALGKTPAVFCGDIGCYTLGNAKPLDAVDTCLCMGAGITMAQGFAVAQPGIKAVAFVGDSTFFASGMTGIANAAYNGHDITIAVLDNATTAMTGSQPHPGTGVTLMGQRRKPLVIEEVLRALGVECITFANPHNLEESTEAARQAIGFSGPSAIIFRAPCIQLKRPEAPVAINGDACTGCKKCIRDIGCPAIGFNPAAEGLRSQHRGQAFVDTGLCDGCGLCVQVCPFDSIQGKVAEPLGAALHAALGVPIAPTAIPSDGPTGSFPPVIFEGETPAEAEEDIDD
ncbi:thiamine pyrophosphate-dependent enzyme [Parvibacter caecicola]|uniref:Indolepyruvate ferredoxin oxidoreductase alpha subunit n=1 Tax=Parvibacter caecicola TaxID=747645 RepID=A0A7W5GPQ0_9ACTN|nr:thiamine pyrophosphate-dependent enzyme [Parvibacter caecicola]MBB3171555.1 indolepyruvate ferredoxin oxidoreductase alpha subunit [Parvibacter caecicola]MCR2040814.1 thiamine pyrophosphate-dependent enzyme [Parvibacter caecicola]RNL11034.1 indolepyruvate oxidoreductase [Parvibacter caecicola]